MAFPVPSRGGDFVLVPDGLTQGVLVDVIDRGFRPKRYQGKVTGIVRKISLRFALELINETTGKPFFIDLWVTYSMHQRAKLRKMIEMGTGKKIPDSEADGYDPERHIGDNFQVLIEHNTSGDKTYANLTSLMPVKKGTPLLDIPDDYERVFQLYKGSVDPRTGNELPDEVTEALTKMAPDKVRIDLDGAIARALTLVPVTAGGDGEEEVDDEDEGGWDD